MKTDTDKCLAVIAVSLVVLGTFVFLPSDARAQGEKPEWTQGNRWEYAGSGQLFGLDASMLLIIEVKGTTQVVVNQSSYDVYHCSLAFTISVGQFADSGAGDA